MNPEIEDVLSYDPETGLLAWKVDGPRRPLGKTAGTKSHGYIVVKFAGKFYPAHRIAWYLTYGVWPSEIDHINRIRSDNRLCNLRETNRRENLLNNGKTRRGVYSNGHGSWYVRIRLNYQHRYLGTFKSYKEACNVASNFYLKHPR